jgi:hypothetical protein
MKHPAQDQGSNNMMAGQDYPSLQSMVLSDGIQLAREKQRYIFQCHFIHHEVFVETLPE